MKIEVVSPPPYEEGRQAAVASGKSEISSFPFSDPRPACEEKARRAPFLEAGGRSPCVMCTAMYIYKVAGCSTVDAGKVRSACEEKADGPL